MIISHFVKNKANITIAIEYKVAYGLSISIFIFDLDQIISSWSRSHISPREYLKNCDRYGQHYLCIKCELYTGFQFVYLNLTWSIQHVKVNVMHISMANITKMVIYWSNVSL